MSLHPLLARMGWQEKFVVTAGLLLGHGLQVLSLQLLAGVIHTWVWLM